MKNDELLAWVFYQAADVQTRNFVFLLNVSVKLDICASNSVTYPSLKSLAVIVK